MVLGELGVRGDFRPESSLGLLLVELQVSLGVGFDLLPMPQSMSSRFSCRLSFKIYIFYLKYSFRYPAVMIS